MNASALRLMIHDPESFLRASLFAYDSPDLPGLLSYGVRGYPTPALACRVTGHRLYEDWSLLEQTRGMWRRCACGRDFQFIPAEVKARVAA